MLMIKDFVFDYIYDKKIALIILNLIITTQLDTTHNFYVLLYFILFAFSNFGTFINCDKRLKHGQAVS